MGSSIVTPVQQPDVMRGAEPPLFVLGGKLFVYSHQDWHDHQRELEDAMVETVMELRRQLVRYRSGGRIARARSIIRIGALSDGVLQLRDSATPETVFRVMGRVGRIYSGSLLN